MRMSSLKGKTALVLGGSRGIGAAIVDRLAAEGAETVFTYAGSKDAAAALAGRTGTRAVQADSADRAAVAKTIAAEGLLDILVVNAGIAVFGDPLEIDPTEVRSEEHTSEPQSLMRISYAVICSKNTTLHTH